MRYLETGLVGATVVVLLGGALLFAAGILIGNA
jgi:hypothetical protein